MNSMKVIPYAQRLPYLNSLNSPSPMSPTFSVSVSLRRTNRRRRKPPKKSVSPKPSTDSPERHQIIIDVDYLKSKASISVERALRSFELKLNQLVYSGTEAYKDLQSLVTLDASSNRIVISCSDTTVRFLGELVIWSCVVVFAFRVLVKLGLGIRGGERIGTMEVVTRRDRSLGGREVVVERRMEERGAKRKDFRALELALDTTTMNRSRREERKLPEWWPVQTPPPVLVVNREDYQKAANKLIRAIMDDRISGKDISEDDILELRRICRRSGAKVSFEADNARDTFYRVSVEFVINTCCKIKDPFTHFDDEDPQLFIAGIADNISLPSVRAATIVSAAVAARTRLWFLQAWALEVQGKHSEALDELLKICMIHRTFPPESFSPEIEMVAKGLEKHLKVEQREFLLRKLVGVCGEGSQRSAAEALGLAHP